MGALQDRVKLSEKVFGENLVDYYRNNTLHLYEKYKASDDMVQSINKVDIQMGGFYHLHYMDDSNWMKYSPIFCADYRKMGNIIVILGVNFNFMPIELRSAIFDKYIIEKDFEDNRLLAVNFKGIYEALIRYGFEYAIVEYNVAQIVQIHRINLEYLPRFLYSSHPRNTYDPRKLMEIWTKKLETKQKRHQEMTKTMLADFYDISGEISEKYDVLTDHISRLQRNFEKYGRP